MDKSIKVLEFIESFLTTNGFAPSVREVCTALGFKSTSTAQYYINKLKNKGLIDNLNSKSRTIAIKNQAQNRPIFVPEVGTVTAGQPILAVENLAGYIPLPPEFGSSNDLFALKISGESMINAGIYDSDKIIVKKTPVCNDGDIIVALIDDSATCKRFFKRDNKIILHPENDTMTDIILDDVVVLGVVKGLIRKF